MRTRPGDLSGVSDAHLVAFYDDDGYLADAVARFLTPAIETEDAALVVATGEHRRLFLNTLEARGVDVQRAQQEGRFLLLDAEQTLATFMVDGLPVAEQFRGTVCTAINQVTAGRRQVRIYGEMVAVLWDEANGDAAIALERQWNDLAASYPISLLCAYPMRQLEQEVGSDSFVEICHQHATVIPDEQFESLVDWKSERNLLLDLGATDGADAAPHDDIRREFVSQVVDEVRAGILAKGQTLLHEARRTIDVLDELLMTEHPSTP